MYLDKGLEIDILASFLFYSEELIEIPWIWCLLLINNSDFCLKNTDLDSSFVSVRNLKHCLEQLTTFS